MPFHVTDPADPPEYVREQRRREADRTIARHPSAIGAEVEVTKDLPAELALWEPRGIVVGVLPGPPAQVAVMVSLARGTEIVLQLLESDVRPV